MAKIIIISISSDIGFSLAMHWKGLGHEVAGTYRTRSPRVLELLNAGIQLVSCDLLDQQSINNSVQSLAACLPGWDALILAPGTQEPVGPFLRCEFQAWSSSIEVNFVNQLQVVQCLLPHKNASNYPLVLFFAGGGTNNATLNYSAYTVSKIALIKMTELLHSEIDDARFCILGPGWVKTKIHDSTIKAKELAGSNYDKTVNMLEGNDWVPMERVIACCDWIFSSPREIVSGRNFSVKFDHWGSTELNELLITDDHMYKLRRSGNDRMVK